MHCSFNSSNLSPSQLTTSSCVLYVLPGNGEDCLSNYSSGSVSNTYMTPTGIFVQGISVQASRGYRGVTTVGQGGQ